MLPDHLVLFDGVCDLCNSSVQRILKNDKNKIFYFASLQSETGNKIAAKNNITSDSIIYVKRGKVYQKSSAVLRIVLKLKFPYPLLGIFLIVPFFIRDFFYDIIARNRYKWFGKRNECMIPEPWMKDRFIDN